jgi:hypothetical protein
MQIKLLIVIGFLVCFNEAHTQGAQNFVPKALRSSARIDSGNNFVRSLSTVGLYGVGNINTESFSNINSAGKLSGFIRPFKKDRQFLTATFSFNVNASNTDSLIANTFLFPDVGKNSFSFNATYSRVYAKDSQNFHLYSLFTELSTKSIKGRRDDSTRNFNTLNWAFGLRYQYLFKKDNDAISLTFSPFISIVNVPDEDNKDYRYLFTGDENSNLKSAITSFGCKITFQYNGLQFFADLRHVFGSEDSVPIRELRGFNQNIGVIFNAELFER